MKNYMILVCGLILAAVTGCSTQEHVSSDPAQVGTDSEPTGDVQPTGCTETVENTACQVGPKGERGEAGPAGERGEKGERGDVGPQGPAGESVVGPQGPVGPMGPQGPAGQSITGPAGPVGPQGARGMDGVQGPAGPKGDRGPAGPAGAAFARENVYVKQVYGPVHDRNATPVVVQATCDGADDVVIFATCQQPEEGGRILGQVHGVDQYSCKTVVDYYSGLQQKTSVVITCVRP